MDKEQKILLNEMPWKDLEGVGIDEKSFLDLPKDAIDRIMSGRLSPLMKLRFMDNEGNAMRLPESSPLAQTEDGVVPAKFRLYRDEQGKVQMSIIPKQKELALDVQGTRLTQEQLDRMKDQETVLTQVKRGGKDEKVYVQLDNELNVVQTTREKDVVIPNAIGDVTIGDTLAQRIREGKPLELEVGDTKVTVGVDLNARGGFRVVEGDMDEWRQRKLQQWDRITPGARGFWHTNENGWEYEMHKKEQDVTREQTVERGTGRKLGMHEENSVHMSMSRGRGR